MAVVKVDLNRLLAQLMVSDIKTKDNPTFQVISQLIKWAQSFQTEVNVTTSSSGSGGSITPTPTNSLKWDVLTDGFEPEAELIYVDGEVIMIHIP